MDHEQSSSAPQLLVHDSLQKLPRCRRRRLQQAGGLLLAALLVQACAGSPHHGGNPHHMTPRHTRAKLSHGQCSPPNGQFNQLGKVVRAGDDNILPSAEECMAACEEDGYCNAWTWCMDERGCVDELLASVPFHGCQMKWEPHEPWGVPTQELAKSFKPSVFMSGYIKRRKPEQKTFIRLHSAPVTQLLIVTSVPQEHCTLSRGDLTNLMGILNKQDYARWHSYQFYLSTGMAEPLVRPKDALDMWAWNKVALMRKVLAEMPPERAPWILYMQPDTIIDDIAFTFPFEMYQGKDWVSVGTSESVLQGWASGIDAGVFLVRNGPFIRALFDRLADTARSLPLPASYEEAFRPDPLAQELAKIIAAEPDTYLDRFNFRSEVCISCDWRHLELGAKSDALQNNPIKSWGTENKHWNLFIARFFACPFCFEDNNMREDEVAACHDAYMEHYEFAFCRFHRMELARHREEELGGSHGHLTELGVPEPFLDALAPPAERVRNIVLKSARQHSTATGQQCYQACLADSRCELWVWCAHKAGCDDDGVFEGSYPHRGCQLMQLAKTGQPDAWDRGPTFSSFESGYITGEHHSRSQVPKGAEERIVIVTGIPTSPCTNPYGDYMLSLSIQNKQDWARLHSHELHQMAEAVTSHIRAGPWQKVGFIQKALNEIPRERAEWILWLDMDLLIDNMDFTFPLAQYEGKNMILHGNGEWIKQGEARAGMNSGVLLMRNTDWTREIIARMATYGTHPMDVASEEHLRANLPTYEVGLYEQNVLTYILYTNHTLLDNVYFDVASYGINCWWKDMNKTWVDNPAFIVHFAGCSTCSGFHPERLGDCDTEYIRTFSESWRHLATAAQRRGLAPATPGSAAAAAPRQHALPAAQDSWNNR